MNEATRHLLRQAQAAFQSGDRVAARRLAEAIVRQDPQCEEGWLLLAALSPPEASLAFLRRALALNPDSQAARRGLAWAKKRLARNKKAGARGRQPPPRRRPKRAARRKGGRWLPWLALFLALWTAGLGYAAARWQAAPTPTAQPWATVIVERPSATPTASPLPSPTPTATTTPTATSTPLPTVLPPAAASTPTPTPIPCRFEAALVDETIPDGSLLAPGETFTKTWTLKNVGDCPWEPGFALVFERGSRMSGAPRIQLGQTVQPGESVSFSVDLAAPQQTGEHTGYWRLQTKEDETFGLAEGESFWVRVQVGPSETHTSLPAAVEEGERWIDIDLSEQRLYAYEGRKLVNTFIVSTGTWQYPTVTGQYRIYVKYRYTDMAGPGYYLPNVPYTMYFYRGYGIHGTYWHNNFGTPMSHGCVNMRTDEAGWIFNWASVGTLVNIHP